MSYRDELASAQERNARLEAELAQTRAELDEARVPIAPAPPPKRRAGVIIGILVGLGVLGGLASVFVVRKAQPVPELVWVYHADDKIPFGTHVRVRGDLVHGSEKRRENPCALEFSIGRGGTIIAVHSDACSAPDTFGRDGFWVIVDGELERDGHFEADGVLSQLKDF